MRRIVVYGCEGLLLTLGFALGVLIVLTVAGQVVDVAGLGLPWALVLLPTVALILYASHNVNR